MGLCNFPDKSCGATCPHCGYALKRDYDKPPIRECKAPPERTEHQHSGLGDRIEAALTAVGVTKESWGAFKVVMGLPAGCDCDRRIAWFNKLGAELGDKAKTAVESLFGRTKPPEPHNK